MSMFMKPLAPLTLKHGRFYGPKGNRVYVLYVIRKGDHVAATTTTKAVADQLNESIGGTVEEIEI